MNKRIKTIYTERRERGQDAQHALEQAKLQDAWERAEAREINGTKRNSK
tara:strand:+ start:574 stop:720 length:147 start_codon:yes stop_codon:yes gene_type:complete